MASDVRFLGPTRPQTLLAILAASGGEGSGDSQRLFSGVAPLASATAQDVSFCESGSYAKALAGSQAGLVLVTAELVRHVPTTALCVICASASLAFSQVAALFHPLRKPDGTIHPSAVIHPDVVIGEGTQVGPMAVIEAGARVGRDCTIGPFALVGREVVLGDGCILHNHCSVHHAVLGKGVVLHAGARIGQEGFGFAMDAQGRFVTAPQLGSVVLGDGVEVGANSCVDRGSLGDTVLGPGTRLDNLVQVGHNVRTGRGCILVAQVGISGSTSLGDYVSMGGQAGVSGHLNIGSKARIAAQAGIIRDVPPGTEMMGSPATPKLDAMRATLVMQRLSAASRRQPKRDLE